MNRIIKTSVLFSVLFVLNGCANDTSTDLLEAKEKLTKDLESLKSQLSAVVSTETAAGTRIDAVTTLANKDDELIRASGHEAKQMALELDALKHKVASLELQLAVATQGKRGSIDRSGRNSAESEETLGSKADNGRTPDQVAAARDYHLEKLTFNTTLPEFKDLYPRLGDPTRSKLGESTYEISAASVGTVSIAFLDDNVITISLRYGEQQLADLGGRKVLMQRLAAKFGEPDTVENDTAKWMFPSADRFILASTDKDAGGVTVTFGKVSGIAQRSDKVRKQDAGF
jgi:hypothetical protein